MNNKSTLVSLLSCLTAWDLIISLLLAVMFAISPQYIANGQLVFSGRTALLLFLYFIAFLGCGILARFFMCRSSRDNSRIAQGVQRFLNKKNSLILLSLFMFLLWLPVLIILYPGTAINDTWGQLSQFVYTFYSSDKIQFQYLGDHHPVLTTFIMGQGIIPAAELTGSLQAAFFVYVLLQAFLTCLAFSYSLLYMYKTLDAGEGFVLSVFCIYSLLPIFPGSAQTICKDAISAWIFVYFTIAFIEIVRTKGEYLDKAYHRDLFILFCWMACATKKVNYYVVFISLLFVLPVIRKNRKYLVGLLIGGVLLFNVLWPAVMNAAGITGGGKTEMLSLPFQMTARYVKEHPDDIREDEYEVIDKMLYMGDLADRYDPISADPVKGFAFFERFEDSDYADYIRVWISQGMRHPGSYINAVLAMESGWFSWTKYYPLLDMSWHNQLDPRLFSEEVTVRPAWNREKASGYQKLLDRIYKIPVIGLLFTYGLYAALIPAFVICTLFTKRKKNGIHGWIGAMPMLLSLALGCWLAPVSVHFEGRRYLYPITYTALIMIAWCRYWIRMKTETD